ncbi:WD40 repeat domain-containing protein [Termitidicoccus mucosus]|uniref:Uncharacterized protein n=1 Tax=Termitidicoccus mucosus TaxID=1184151 RepID=A0A178ILZ4_9BACT|nr:hypothetical protein AW736_06725 [Opitutaceae bacterium TSB47]
MPPARYFPITPLLVALLAAFLLPGCSKTPEDHARIAKNGSGDYSEQKRLASVRALAAANEQTLLADVAANAADANTQGAALDKLTDERLLADVIKDIEHRSDSIVTAARMEKITDPQLLASLAREARSLNVRVTAAITLGDQALLADIARNGADGLIRKRAIENLADPALADIAVNEREQFVRVAAARRVTDQALLASLAQNEKADKLVRAEAGLRLDDQRILAAIAKAGGKDAEERSVLEPLRLKALERLTDQRALADIAKNVAGEITFESRKDDQRILEATLERISDQAALADIAMSAHPTFAFPVVLEKITDQEALVRLLKNNQANDEIVKKLTDQKLLAEIAGGDDFEHVRMEAANRLTDPQALFGLARRGKDEGIALAAVKKIADPQMLAEIAGDENASTNARLWALWRVADRTLLAKIAKDTADERVRNAASEKLSGATPGTTPQTIADLIKNGKLLAEIGGSDIQRIYVHLQKIVPSSLEILIPAGTYFVCDNPNAQNMVSTEDVRITLAESQTKTGANAIPVACANRPKDIPGGSDHFTIGSLPNGDELAKLMAFLKGKNTAFAVKQAAVWILTDDADYEDLGKLIVRTTRIGDSRFSPISERRMIQEPEAAAAMRLCADAGIDIKKKNIWSNAVHIYRELGAGELKHWLKESAGIGTLPAHTILVDALFISNDGKLLVSSAVAAETKLWRLPEGAHMKTLRGEHCLALSPGGKWLLTADDNHKIKLRHLPDGKLVMSAPFESEPGTLPDTVDSAVFSPDERYFVTGDHRGNIQFWSLPHGHRMPMRQTHGDRVSALSITPDGRLLASGGDDGFIKLWSLPECATVKTLELERRGKLASVDYLACSADGKLLVSGCENTVRLWSLPDGVPANALDKYRTGKRREFSVSPNGKWLFAASDERPEGSEMKKYPEWKPPALWHLPEGRLAVRPDAIGEVWASTFSPDNKLLLTGDGDGNIKLWSLPDGKLIKTLDGE